LFVSAITEAAAFTRPLHFISRSYGTTAIVPGAGTLFFVNSDGWAFTCRHVAEQLLVADQLRINFDAFKAERACLTPGKRNSQELRLLEKKYSYAKGRTIELYSLFVDCVEGSLNLDIRIHPEVDVALLRFQNHTRLLCDKFPVFAADASELQPGKYLCRLGYPFPEFENFEYDAVADRIAWTTIGRQATPRFPIEGMVTRHLLNAQGAIVGIELSTAGLRGQSGGPAFGTDGRIWGMQAATAHLDLEFDIDVEVRRGAEKKRVRESAFLHVGHCIHVDVLKQFMRQHGVTFSES